MLREWVEAESRKQCTVTLHDAKDLWVVLQGDGVKILCETVTGLRPNTCQEEYDDNDVFIYKYC